MNNSFLIGVLVFAVIIVVGWVAYSQGYFNGTDDTNSGIELNVRSAGDDSNY